MQQSHPSVSYLNLPRKLPANCNVRTAVRHALEWHQGVTFYLNNDCKMIIIRDLLKF
ncbi:hypothetical protein [Wolbachia endosymbiont (group A) of Anomoia purmunda]|uniref:hypothetical protein n=1 Tax=Wolbachia endosymbiont (group A) of Anomoia purmunda TaxID=2953978 RepID=UPI0022323A70|nr:hypothetical protein [Wolbachia endosymbiont (group A) of Anomoia purmunda]